MPLRDWLLIILFGFTLFTVGDALKFHSAYTNVGYDDDPNYRQYYAAWWKNPYTSFRVKLAKRDTVEGWKDNFLRTERRFVRETTIGSTTWWCVLEIYKP